MPAKSRQRAWQRKMVSRSRCAICGRARGRHPGYCDLHYHKQLNRMRKTAGQGKWIPGHTGRPPVDRTSQTLTHLAKRLKEMGYRINANRRKK